MLVLEDGLISLDLPIDLPTPRSRRDPRFQEYRDALLTALGVTTPSAAPHDSPKEKPHVPNV